MSLRAFAIVWWCVLVAEAVLVAPPARPDQSEWLWRLLSGEWAGEEPAVIALFNLMGVWPFALAAQLAPWLRRRPVPLWPFAIGSMFLGAFVLLPGIAIGGTPVPAASWQRWLAKPAWLAVLALATFALVAYGATGSAAGFAHAFRTEQFVHVMTLDFVSLWALSILVARERGGPWAITAVPVLGSLAWTARAGR